MIFIFYDKKTAEYSQFLYMPLKSDCFIINISISMVVLLSLMKQYCYIMT